MKARRLATSDANACCIILSARPVNPLYRWRSRTRSLGLWCSNTSIRLGLLSRSCFPPVAERRSSSTVARVITRGCGFLPLRSSYPQHTPVVLGMLLSEWGYLCKDLMDERRAKDNSCRGRLCNNDWKISWCANKKKVNGAWSKVIKLRILYNFHRRICMWRFKIKPLVHKPHLPVFPPSWVPLILLHRLKAKSLLWTKGVGYRKSRVSSKYRVLVSWYSSMMSICHLTCHPENHRYIQGLGWKSLRPERSLHSAVSRNIWL